MAAFQLRYPEEVGQESTPMRAFTTRDTCGHNMLMVGPPGAGKSMLAARLPSILPPLDPRELLDISMIQSIAGELVNGALSDRGPFRAPHHSASMAALVGGGLRVRPGEVSLAHNGVLFLDELPEFAPSVLDSLRQPLESGETVIARANARVSYPSRVQLIAAMNPCKCGLAGTPGHTCRRGKDANINPSLDRQQSTSLLPTAFSQNFSTAAMKLGKGGQRLILQPSVRILDRTCADV